MVGALIVQVSNRVAEWYKQGRDWEIKPVTPGEFDDMTVFKGRQVFVGRAHRGKLFHGVIDKDPVIGSLEKILSFIPYKMFVPTAEDEAEAYHLITEEKKGPNYTIYIAFHIAQNKTSL